MVSIMNNLLFDDLYVLKTERLIIRKTLLDDVDLLLKMDKQNITQKYLGGVKNKTRNERILFLKNKTNILTVSLLDDTKIGFIELKTKDGIIELSYIFDFDYINNGYCTEACKNIIDFIFNNSDLNKLYANVIIGNDNSKRVLDKLGFKCISKKDNNILEYVLIKESDNNGNI